MSSGYVIDEDGEEVFAITTQRVHGHICPGCSGWACYDEECQSDGVHKFYWSERECPDCEEEE